MTSPGMNKKKTHRPSPEHRHYTKKPKIDSATYFSLECKTNKKKHPGLSELFFFGMEKNQTRRIWQFKVCAIVRNALTGIPACHSEFSNWAKAHEWLYILRLMCGHGHIYMFINIWTYHCPHHSLHQHCNALSIYTGCFFLLFTLKF